MNCCPQPASPPPAWPLHYNGNISISPSACLPVGRPANCCAACRAPTRRRQRPMGATLMAARAQQVVRRRAGSFTARPPAYPDDLARKHRATTLRLQRRRCGLRALEPNLASIGLFRSLFRRANWLAPDTQADKISAAARRGSRSPGQLLSGGRSERSTCGMSTSGANVNRPPGDDHSGGQICRGRRCRPDCRRWSGAIAHQSAPTSRPIFQLTVRRSSGRLLGARAPSERPNGAQPSRTSGRPAGRQVKLMKI